MINKCSVISFIDSSQGISFEELIKKMNIFKDQEIRYLNVILKDLTKKGILFNSDNSWYIVKQNQTIKKNQISFPNHCYKQGVSLRLKQSKTQFIGQINNETIIKSQTIAQKEEMRGKKRKSLYQGTWKSGTLLRLDIDLWPNQKNAINLWKNKNLYGIIEMATATGKTIVGLKAIEILCNDFTNLYSSKTTRILILCNSLAILDQWHKEIITKFHISGELTGHNKINLKIKFKNISIEFYTLQKIGIEPKNMSIKELQTKYSSNLIIVDEVHHILAPTFRNALKIQTKAFLGLSATIEGNFILNSLDSKLGKSIYTYTISEAVRDGIIPHFDFFIHETKLTPYEMRIYKEKTMEIIATLRQVKKHFNIITWLHKKDPNSPSKINKLSDYLKLMNVVKHFNISSEKLPKTWFKLRIQLLVRRDILHKSENKQKEAINLASDLGKFKKCIIFHNFIDSCIYIDYELKRRGINTFLLHSKIENIDKRIEILESFRFAKYGVLITPKLLDEGVDIPDAEIGINVAYSTRKLQLIQRLGRILRKYQDKKPEFHHLTCKEDRSLGKILPEVLEGLRYEQGKINNQMKVFGNKISIRKLEC